MEPSNIDGEISDDEIHFGKITIKEIKKMFCKRQGPSKTYDVSPKADPNTSLRLIETHSQPNLRSKTVDSPVISYKPDSPALDKKFDESLIKTENMVSELCMSPRNSDNVELNNTLEVIDYILNHGPNLNNIQDPANKVAKTSPEVLTQKISPMKESTPIRDDHKITEKTDFKGSPKYYTPAKSVMKKPLFEFATPSSSIIKSKTPVFKTPANSSTLTKPSTPRFTPGRTNAYRHIASPIAAYIKNCPQVPLVKDVHPKKPLPGVSFIPKLVRNQSQGEIQMNKNKENFHLPSVAYKSAKKTKVIQLPDQDKLPQSQWVKSLTSFPRPSVMKHERREKNPVMKRLLSNQEESFDNLPCHQAEVSYCTEKTAFKSTNKH